MLEPIKMELNCGNVENKRKCISRPLVYQRKSFTFQNEKCPKVKCARRNKNIETYYTLKQSHARLLFLHLAYTFWVFICCCFIELS